MKLVQQLALAAFLIASTDADALEFDEPALAEEIGDAAIVAMIEITGTQPVLFVFDEGKDGRGHPCGRRRCRRGSKRAGRSSV